MSRSEVAGLRSTSTMTLVRPALALTPWAYRSGLHRSCTRARCWPTRPSDRALRAVKDWSTAGTRRGALSTCPFWCSSACTSRARDLAGWCWWRDIGVFRWLLCACCVVLCAVLPANGSGQPCSPTRAKKARQASKSWRVSPHRVTPYSTCCGEWVCRARERRAREVAASRWLFRCRGNAIVTACRSPGCATTAALRARRGGR